MPSKSRRSRRNISQNPAVKNPEYSKPPSVQSASTITAQPGKPVNPGRNTVAAVVYPNIGREIMWIGLVTLIVIAILIVLYYTVR
jgi:hypothetical protein